MTPETSIYEYAKQGLELSADKTAIWFYGKNLTYRELFWRIDNVADHLASLGVKRGTVVTIHLPNCPQAVMAVYAVAKLGGICNMIHPLTPLKALKENMKFTESKVLISGNHFPEINRVDFTDLLLFVNMTAHMGTVYGIGYRLRSRGRHPDRAIKFEWMERPCENPFLIPEQSSLAEECAAYLNSSGTTGTPKTVMHCHRALNQETVNAKAGFGLGAVNNEVSLEILPMFHGMGLIIDLHIALSGGAEIVQMAFWDEHLAVKLMTKRHVTIMTAVPTVYYRLLQNKNFSGKEFRRFFAGGDVFDIEQKGEFKKRFGKNIDEGYGMTELVASFCGEHPTDGRRGLIPFPNCHLAVLSAEEEPALHGRGEFIVSSNTMMLGYLKDEEATESVQIRWNNRDWIKTGDYGVINADGSILFRERVKNIIVYNGYNVYPTEVELAILKTGLAEEVCVVGIWDESQCTQMVYAAIILKEPNNKNADRAIIAYCAKVLPKYAVPKRCFFFDHFPRNTMQKVERNVLKKWIYDTKRLQ